MTTKTATARANADSFATLRNDNQKGNGNGNGNDKGKGDGNGKASKGGVWLTGGDEGLPEFDAVAFGIDDPGEAAVVGVFALGVDGDAGGGKLGK